MGEKFFFKPIASIIAKRQEEADSIIKNATEKENEAKELANKYQDKLAAAEQEKKQIIADARKNADAQYQRIVANAKEDAQSIHDTAVVEANQQRDEIIASAKREVADLVVGATSKVVGFQTGIKVDNALFDEFLGKAGEQ